MKRPRSSWHQPEGWMTYGAVVVVVLLVIYLVFVVVRYFVPRLRDINKAYNVAQAMPLKGA